MNRLNPLTLIRIKLAVAPLATSLALLGPAWTLAPLALWLLWAIARRPGGRQALWQLRLPALFQGGFIALLYLVRFGTEGLADGALLWARMMLMLLPGLWFFLSTETHQVVQALRGLLGNRQALILATSLNLLPRLARESVELYQLQRLRGHPLAPADLWRPRGWRALCKLVLLPLLIRLIRLSQQQATALKARGYREQGPTTHFPTEEQP